ncbi:MAG: tetratricopeptide repeat protein [Magnetococcales bacterium]|nr:tetratricopeptide repeat protein [Magnetococcales bacterium]
MTTIGIFSGILLISLGFVFWPVWSKKGNHPLPVGLEDDPVWELEQRRLVLLGQLKERELDGNEEGSGRMSLEAELAEVYAELDGRQLPQAMGATPAVTTARFRWLDRGSSVVMAVAMAILGVVLFGGLGNLDKSGKAGEASMMAPESAKEMNALLDKAFERLKGEPDNLTAWLRLARSFSVVQRNAEAMEAYAFILKNHPQEMQARVGLAGLKVQTATTDGEMAVGEELFKAILQDDPGNQDALWFLGGVAVQSGAVEEARDYWQRLLERLPPGDPNREMVLQALTELPRK